MAATFSNPRLSALPCEMMRGCSFAEDFITAARVADNKGLVLGLVTVNRGSTYPGGTVYHYFTKQTQPGSFSITVRFMASATSSAGVLITTANNLVNDTLDDGFCVWVDADGVKANHCNGATLPTKCEVDLDYADGTIHTATYVVDMTGGYHYLYVDALAVNSQATTINEEIGETSTNIITGLNFAGTIYKPRIFDAILTESEHDLYHLGSITSFAEGQGPLAVYRCDEICDDTDGHKIWDRTLDQYDLYKADRSATAKMPVLQTDKYFFDKVDDYISNWPTLPTNYTVVAAVSSPQLPWPAIRQENDATLMDELSTEGDYWGYLNNLAIHGSTLTQLQLYHTEYMHKYMLQRGRAQGLYHRLITEGTAKLVMFMDYTNSAFFDHSQFGNSGPGKGGVTISSSGVDFPNATSHVHVNSDTSLDCADEISIVLYGDFTLGGGEPAQTFVDKGGNYKFRQNGLDLDFNGSTFTCTAGTYTQIGVVCKDGYKPRFFVEHAFVGEGSTTETLTADTTELTLGNNNELNERSQSTFKNVYIGDETLTDDEVRAMGEIAQYIGVQAMETGNRTPVEDTYTAVAVDQDFDPGGPFQLIDVVVNLSAAATTSENLVIKTIRTADTAVTVTEESYDLSLTSDTSIPFLFNKRFADNVTVGVDYPNTDGLTITVVSTYQLDQSVV